MFLHERRQHTVGQGFFHSGYLRIGSGEFSYVYDCGSENTDTLAREINEFANRRHKRPGLNVLFISHFDSDHVNGLDRLLSLVKTKTVVAPYLEPCERLLLVADAADSGSVDGTLVQFAADPVRWLGDRGVEVVLFVKGGEEEEGPRIALPEPQPWPHFQDPERRDTPIDLDWNWLKRRALETGSPRTTRTSTGATTESFVLPHHVALPLLGARRLPMDWAFLTFVHPEGALVRRFRDAVRREFRRTPFDNKRWTKACNEWLVDTVQDRSCRERLAGCYAVIRRNRNLTSMSLYSGPVIDGVADGWLYAFSARPEHP